MATVRGQPIILQTTSNRFHMGFITRVISGDNVDLVAFSDTSDWETMADGPSNVSYLFFSIDKGTGTYQWQENSAGLGPTGATGSTGAAGAGFGTITENRPGITSGVAARVVNTSFQPSATAPCQVSYRATASVTASLAGNNSGRVRLMMCPTQNGTYLEYPGAVGVVYNLGLGVAIANTNTNEGWLGALVPIGWWVKIDVVTVTGTITGALVSNATLAGAQVEQVLA